MTGPQHRRPPARGRRGHPEAGFSLVEVIVAAVILAATLASAARVLGSSAISLSRSRARDQAVVLAQNTLERARTFGCGLDVGDEDDFEQRARRCFEARGDARFEDTGSNVDYTVTFSPRWVHEPTPSCADLTDVLPHALVRTVEVEWNVAGDGQRIERVVREALPPDAAAFRSSTRGHLVVDGVGDQTVEVWPVGEAARAVARSSEAGCPWFPFLTPGCWAYRTDAGTGTASISDRDDGVLVNGAAPGLSC